MVFLLVFISTVLGALGGFFFKLGASVTPIISTKVSTNTPAQATSSSSPNPLANRASNLFKSEKIGVDRIQDSSNPPTSAANSQATTGTRNLLFRVFSSLVSYVSWFSLLGLALFTASSLLYFYALTKGSLNVLYPLTSLTYVWTLIIGKYVLAERVDFIRILGVATIALGIVFVLL